MSVVKETAWPTELIGGGEIKETIAPSATVPSRRFDFLDGVRALAALFVVVCHAYFEPANGYYSSRLMNHLGLTYGHVAVDVFIVLSGFCLMLPIARRSDHFGSVREFFRRRARRILPPYYAALLLSILFILVYAHNRTGTVWDNSLPLTWTTFLYHLLLVHDLPLPGTGGTINYPLWTIAVEFQLYLVMPLIALSLRSWNSSRTLLWTIALGLGLHVGLHGKLDSASPWYLGLFTMGAVAAREAVRRAQPQTNVLRWTIYVLVPLTGAVVVMKGKDFFEAYMPFFDTVLGAATATLLYITFHDASEQRSRLTRSLSWRPLVAIGTFSYSLYLVHAPLLHLFDRIFAPYLPAGPRMFVALLAITPIIVGIAYLFHRVFEKPFMSGNSQPKRAVS
ncbi:MAG: acyltransferase 3 [Chthonomonadaceae bacterium]|nr:acyltransferase 3 [Chthonomonadaceae bacterium]